jgi:prevent-host-death family protein
LNATIFETKTRLSELVKRAQAGEEVIITSGRNKEPVAKLLPVKKVKLKRLGLYETPGWELGEAFWEPLPAEELRLWNGESE